MTFVKICGLTQPDDARVAEEAGAVYGGVILAPGSPRTVTPEQAARLFAGTRLRRCGVFVNESAPRVATLARQLDLAVVQLHGDESPEYAAALRTDIDVEVWKAIRPRDADEFAAALSAYDGMVDGLLADGWSAAARGGTGTRFPWAAVAAHRDQLRPGTRLIAAGGLHAGNIADVIATLRPEGVDVSSGVEREPGRKDHESIHAFIDAVRSASASRGVA